MGTEPQGGPRPIGSMLVGLYCWSAAALFGAVVLDVVYARSIRAALGPAQVAAVTGEASDFLLLMVGLTVLAAVVAKAGCWQSRSARNLVIASASLVGAQIVAPLVLGPLALQPGSGAWLRLLLSASASVLAFAGLARLRSPS